MSGLLASYEADYEDTLRQVRASIERLQHNLDAQAATTGSDPTRVYHPPPATGPLSRGQQLQALLQLTAQLKDLVTSMSYEANDIDDVEQRAQTKARVDARRRSLAALDDELQTLRRRCAAADRSDLLAFGERGGGGGGDDDERGQWVAPVDAATRAQRLGALQATERMQGGTQVLHKAEAYLAQSSAMGHETYTTLRTQTEQLQRIHGVTDDVDVELTQSQQLLRRMQRTALKHKAYLCLVIVVLVLAIGLLIYMH